MSNAIKALLNELEAELKQQRLWSALPPDATALTSTLPFCFDTLQLEQWLQFIFIPRMRALLDAKSALPGIINISPIAGQMFKRPQLRPLLNIIARVDAIRPGDE